jgi:hypothetical protein
MHREDFIFFLPFHITGKPSSGRAPAEYYIPWAELLRRTMGIDPEICQCGARMVVDDVITDRETITATVTRMGLSSVGPVTGPPNVSRSTGELDYIYDV